MTPRLIPLAAALLLAGCDAPPPAGPVAASVIGEELALVDPSRRPIDAADAVLLTAVAQGLVRFDAAGLIEPGLAVRWDVSDDGLYYTFRLAADRAIDAEDAARILRAAIAPRSRNPLKPALGGIAEIVAVTPEVIEIRLAAASPSLLSLLARPELALIEKGTGTGPMRIEERREERLLLVPDRAPDEEPLDPEAAALARVSLRADRAALAIARFVRGEVGLVLGGDMAGLALLAAAQPTEGTVRFDPVAGLFGLAFLDRPGFTAVPEHRRALSMAIDRVALAAALPVSGWQASPALGTGAPPPDWAALPIAERRAAAAEVVAAAIADGGERPRLRVALPSGASARRLFGRIAADWRLIGVDAEAVGLDAPADLRLIDRVAPADDRRWYLRSFACTLGYVCSGIADAALAAGDVVAADGALAGAHPFIAFGPPIRWSLVTPALRGFQANARAAHPLDQLREP